MICPYCQFPITTTSKTLVFKGDVDSGCFLLHCKHCGCMLRSDITTLKAPDKDFRTNETEQQIQARQRSGGESKKESDGIGTVHSTPPDTKVKDA